MTLALIAGTGGMPPFLAATLQAKGQPPLICEMDGTQSEVPDGFDRLPFRMERLGLFLAALTARGVTQVCMVGTVHRPLIDPSLIDPTTAPLVPRLMAAMAKGDDGTLRGIIEIFVEHGLEVVGAHQIAPQLLPVAGVLTKVAPPDLRTDLAIAVNALAEMGRMDMGQAVLMRDGQVLAREDERGTDALLADFCAPVEREESNGDPLGALIDGVGDVLGEAADWLSGVEGRTDNLPGKGAFLYKAPKPGQELRADMPVIGPATAMRAAEAGLSGIVIAEGGVMVMDQRQVVAILDAQGMFLWVTP